MVVAAYDLPRQTVVPVVCIHERELARTVLDGIVEVGGAYFSGLHVDISHIVVDRQVARRTELELAIFLHTAVTDVDERGRLGGVGVNGMAVGIFVHGGEGAAVAVVLLRYGTFIYLRTVLEWRRLELESSRIEVLVDASTIVPAVLQTAVDVQRYLVESEVVSLIVQRTVESVLAEVREGVDGIADIAGGDGCLGNLQQSDMRQAGIGTPRSIHAVGVGSIGNGQTILQDVDIGRRQTNLDFARTVGA